MIEPPDGRGGPQRIPRPEAAYLGGPAPWSHLDPERRQVDLERLHRRLDGRPAAFADRGLAERGSRSAVLIPLWNEGAEAMVLLTRRSPHMRSHTHEVSFPGGRHDDTDASLMATALREATEEVALDTSGVTVIGELDQFVTGGSGSLVHPFVALLDQPPTGLVANPAEVEAILRVPLRELLLDEVWREELWSRDGGALMPVTFFELHGDTVWGATGNMLRQLLTIATE